MPLILYCYFIKFKLINYDYASYLPPDLYSQSGTDLVKSTVILGVNGAQLWIELRAHLSLRVEIFLKRLQLFCNRWALKTAWLWRDSFRCTHERGDLHHGWDECSLFLAVNTESTILNRNKHSLEKIRIVRCGWWLCVFNAYICIASHWAKQRFFGELLNSHLTLYFLMMCWHECYSPRV